MDNQLHLIILRNGFTMKMDDVSGDATFVILTGDGNAHNNITSFPGVCFSLFNKVEEANYNLE